MDQGTHPRMRELAGNLLKYVRAERNTERAVGRTNEAMRITVSPSPPFWNSGAIDARSPDNSVRSLVRSVEEREEQPPYQNTRKSSNLPGEQLEDDVCSVSTVFTEVDCTMSSGCNVDD